MQPVPKSIFKQKPPHNHFRLGILAPDSAHIVASYFGFVYVGHSWYSGALKVAKTFGGFAGADRFGTQFPPFTP